MYFNNSQEKKGNEQLQAKCLKGKQWIPTFFRLSGGECAIFTSISIPGATHLHLLRG